jgi:hypothetical protein
MADGDRYLVQIGFEMDSGLPEDVAVNTFHFVQEGAIEPINNLMDMVEDFYTVVAPGNGSAVFSFLAARLSGEYTITVYNLSDAPPRIPVGSRTGTFTPGTNTLPTEVALCVSYQAAQVSGQPQARRRGRIFIGPLAHAAEDSNNGVPSPAIISTLANAAAELLSAAQASTSAQWIVYSPTGNSHADVDNGWVDNAFDTQRRRGQAATARTLWS